MIKGYSKVKLGDVCGFQNGFAFKSKSFKNTGIPVIRITNIRNETVDLSNVVYVEPSDYDKDLSSFQISKDDILIAMSGATTGKIGVHTSHEKLFLNQRVGKFIPSAMLDREYLFKYLSTKVEESLAISLGAAQPNLSTEQIKNFLIPLPPIEEQQRLVLKLDGIFKKIKKVESNLARNKINAQALFENYLDSVFETGGEEWDEILLGEIASFRNGMNYSKNGTGEEVKIVGVGDFKDSYWIPMETLKSIKMDAQLSDLDVLKDGDILVVRSNGNPKLIGRSIVARNVNCRASHSGFTIRIRMNGFSIHPELLTYFLKTSTVREKLVKSGNGVGIKSLNQGSLGALLLSFPKKLEEQILLLQQLKQLENKSNLLKSNYQTKLVEVEMLRKSVLQKAFNGEL